MSNVEGKPKAQNDETPCQHYLVVPTFVIRISSFGPARSLPQEIICYLHSVAYFPVPTANAAEHLSTWSCACGIKSASEVGKIDNKTTAR
jgi:hypothetical protein